MGIILNRLSRSFTLISIAVLCCMSMAGPCFAQQPQAGVYFDYGDRRGDTEFRVYKSGLRFDAYLVLAYSYLPVTGIEYSLKTPDDPSHNQIAIFNYEYSDNSLVLGDAFHGHSITFWPPFDISGGHFVLCKYTFISLDNCDAGMNGYYPIIVSPHPDSGYLRGTYYPDHVLFDITGKTSYLCPDHWPPMLSDVQVFSPRSVRAWFNQCVYGWEQTYDDNFILYTTAEPHDTIGVINAVKHSPLDEQYDDFFIYLESPMQPGVDYTLKASVSCECHGWLISTKSFVYEGGFAPGPDLAVTYWISNEIGPVDDASDCSEVELDYIVRNLGTAACGPFLSRITVAPLDGAEPVTVWSDSCGRLAVNETLEGTVSIILPSIPALTGYVRFEADHPGWISEANEEDNHKDALFWNFRPLIMSVEDVPGDYGGQVELTFNGSWHDIDRPAEDDIYRILRLDRASDDWEDVHQFEATSDTIYTCTVPTAVDSSDSSGNYWSVFMVEYYRSSYPVHSSCPDSGYSVNDLGPTAVLLLASSIEASGESIVLKWSITECPDFGEFSISRAVPCGRFHNIGSLPVPPGELSFEFEDQSAEPGTDYIYRVEYTDYNGTHILFETEPAGLPRLHFALHQNRPNPFNPSTEIGFSLPEPSAVTLDIYNVSGKRVRRLLEESRPAGNHSVHWDGLYDSGSPAVSGVYFYRLTAGKSAHSRKMILLR